MIEILGTYLIIVFFNVVVLLFATKGRKFILSKFKFYNEENWKNRYRNHPSDTIEHSALRFWSDITFDVAYKDLVMWVLYSLIPGINVFVGMVIVLRLAFGLFMDIAIPIYIALVKYKFWNDKI